MLKYLSRLIYCCRFSHKQTYATYAMELDYFDAIKNAGL
ncbi:hypothetical protein PPRY_a3394 [Pseudoalteromonas prydzensis ACAM 620]|nr:hypothetical protein [Pseudoalteromonas prydzensis ACAM 620]